VALEATAAINSEYVTRVIVTGAPGEYLITVCPIHPVVALESAAYVMQGTRPLAARSMRCLTTRVCKRPRVMVTEYCPVHEPNEFSITARGQEGHIIWDTVTHV
jgi:hypothetical protein